MRPYHLYLSISEGAMASSAPSAVDASADGIPSGRIRWEVDKDLITKKNLFSHEIEVGGIKWALCANKNIDEGNNPTMMGLYLQTCEGDYEIQSVTAAFELKLLNHKDDSKTITEELSDIFIYYDSWGFPNYIKWNEAIDNEQGFIKDNKLTFLCKFELLDIIGFRKIQRIDFTVFNERYHDVTFIIEGEKIYAGKQILSIHSTVFEAMFYNDFAEKNQSEIELKDVVRKEFVEMLKVIHPPYLRVRVENVDFLLKLGDRFDMKSVLSQCEEYLITSDSLTTSEKLLRAGQYRLVKLEVDCVGNLKTAKDVKDLKDTDEYKDFSDGICLALFRKMMEFDY